MDTIGDFLTRIRNSGMAGHEKVDVPSSNMRVGIANKLKQSGYIKNFKVAKDGKQGVMRVYLSYDAEGKPLFSKLRRVSKCSKRVYVGAKDIKRVRSGYGMSILSTNKGIISGEEATNMNIGGELLCEIW